MGSTSISFEDPVIERPGPELSLEKALAQKVHKRAPNRHFDIVWSVKFAIFAVATFSAPRNFSVKIQIV